MSQLDLRIRHTQHLFFSCFRIRRLRFLAELTSTCGNEKRIRYPSVRDPSVGLSLLLSFRQRSSLMLPLEKMNISFAGISNISAVFERLSIGFAPRLDVQQGNDWELCVLRTLRSIFVLTRHWSRDNSSQIRARLFECLFVSKKYLDHFSFDDLNWVTNLRSVFVSRY